MGEKKSVLVTGGAGFIGSHLVERLLAEGCRVTVIDDCSTGSPENLTDVLKNPDLVIKQIKVSECHELGEVVESCDYVYHLAAAVGVELVVNSPIATIHTNLKETEALLEAASVRKTPTLVASTSEVYGKSAQEEFKESDDLLIGPPYLARWGYACSKLMDEFMAMAFFHERGLPVVVTRFFNTVGPRQTGRYGMVLPRFIEAALNNRPLRIFGTGEQSRCFCHVRDTVEALMLLKNCPDSRGQVVNIGGTDEISIQALAERVITELDSTSTIEKIPYSEAYAPGFEDMLRRKPSVEKLESITGFRPLTGLSEIIGSTAESLRRLG
jgi:UDP-glucose 4-epimerase